MAIIRVDRFEPKKKERFRFQTWIKEKKEKLTQKKGRNKKRNVSQITPTCENVFVTKFFLNFAKKNIQTKWNKKKSKPG